MRVSLDGLRRAWTDDDVRAISRRYFVSNGFDGTLTSVGVIVGAYITGIESGVVVVQIGLGAAVGLGTSGVWSVWEIERAEKLAEIRDLEAAMLTDLDETRIMHRMEAGRLLNALFSGLGPVLAVLLSLSPFLLEGSVLTMLWATVAGVGVGVALLFVFGAYLGEMAGLSWWVAGARMGLAGLVVAGISVLLPG